MNTFKVILFFLFLLKNYCSFSQDKYEYIFHLPSKGDISITFLDENNNAIVSDKIEIVVDNKISFFVKSDQYGECRHIVRLNKGKHKLSFGIKGFQPLITQKINIEEGKTNFLLLNFSKADN